MLCLKLTQLYVKESLLVMFGRLYVVLYVCMYACLYVCMLEIGSAVSREDQLNLIGFYQLLFTSEDHTVLSP